MARPTLAVRRQGRNLERTRPGQQPHSLTTALSERNHSIDDPSHFLWLFGDIEKERECNMGRHEACPTRRAGHSARTDVAEMVGISRHFFPAKFRKNI